MTMKLNTTDRKTLTTATKHGFTWAGDAGFRTHTQGIRCLNRLVKLGLMERVAETPEHKITEAGRDSVAYKFTGVAA
jgi:hypothetical protein